MKRSIALIGGLLMFCAVCGVVGAQQPQARVAQTADLAAMNIEDLMNIEVTSVSNKEQKMSQVATAMFVITQEDIGRSGATNLPDLLRMVPGVDVAQINANTWAISARGFNHQFSDKLLVMIAGRTVYTPILGGAYWDTQDFPLEDIDRIEVIRGPGATVWGANAVNGVINILTKKAGDTLGTLVTGGGGTQDQAFGTVQYGGAIKGNTSYRVFTKYLDHNHFSGLPGQDAADGWHLLHGGFRADGSPSPKDSLTVPGDLYAGREGASIDHIVSFSPPDNENATRRANLSGGNVLHRWNHIFSDRADTTLQFYFDRYTRSGPESHEVRNTFDLDFQHRMAWGGRQDLSWGAGYRRSADQTIGTIDQAWVPATRTIQLYSTFVQDEITLIPNRIFITVGTKLEHSDFTGFELEPSARVTWTPSDRQKFWTSVSEAARTPARNDADGEFNVAVFRLLDGTTAELTGPDTRDDGRRRNGGPLESNRSLDSEPSLHASANAYAPRHDESGHDDRPRPRGVKPAPPGPGPVSCGNVSGIWLGYEPLLCRPPPRSIRAFLYAARHATELAARRTLAAKRCRAKLAPRPSR